MPFCGVPAFAQDDLTKEIKVETDYKPTEQKATKLNRLPSVTNVKVQNSSLKYSDWAVPTVVNPTVTLLKPYGYRTTYDFSKRRGYLDLSAGSLLNITGSAGYKVVDNGQTELNLWLQHNSTWAGKNKTTSVDEETAAKAPKQKFNNNIVGIDLSHTLHQGIFSASLFYHYDHFNYYGNFDYPEQMQTVNEFQIQLGWKNPRNDNALKYSARLMFNHFGFSKGNGYAEKNTDDKGNANNHLRLLLNGESNRGNLRFGADVSAEYLGVTYDTDAYATGTTLTSNGRATESLGLVKLSPYVKYSDNNGFDVRVGVNLDVSVNDGSTLRFSPNADLSYAFADGVAFYLQAKGGKSLSTLHDYFSINRYIDPEAILTNMYAPIDGEGGLKFGPFSGFTAKVYGGYGIFKDVPLPALHASEYTAYLPSKMQGWKAGAELGYKFRSIAEVKLNATYAPQKDDGKGYFLGFDRAKFVGKVTVEATPIEKLKIGIDYTLRCKRWLKAPLDDIEYDCLDLGNMSSLSLGASYQVTDMIGVFVEGNNLLNKKYDDYFGMSAQQLNVLGGVSVVF